MCMSGRPKLMAIHRMLEFVVREGPLFEAMIMNKEADNELYSFLFDNQSAEHTYYRWKLFSILHGDSPQRWRTDEFRMFKGGSVWKPPPMNPYMMDRDHHKKPEPERQRNKLLSQSQRARFESQLRHLTLERDAIAETMVWCLEHADSAEEICACIARLYLISDILHNCTVKVANASSFRKCFQDKLPEIFDGIQETYGAISSRLRAEAFKQRVMRVFRAWEDWAVYPQDFLINLQNTFLGFNKQTEGGAAGDGDTSDVDGAPLSDSDDVDGVPLDGAALLKKARQQANDDDDDDDVDGVPLDEAGGPSVDRGTAGALARAAESAGRAGGFVPSRWETVDPTDVAAGAVTTSRWEAVSAAAGAAARQQDSDDDVDGVPLEEVAGPPAHQPQPPPPDDDSRSQTNTAPGSPDMDVSEERRVKLREVELKVVAYQDDLESGQRSVKTGYTLQEQVQHYRAKLMRKVERQLTDRKRRRERSPSSSDGESHQSYSSRRRSRSPKPDRSDRSRRRSRSHSPPRRRRRSKSPPYRRSRSRSPAYRRSRSRSRSRSPSRKMRKKSKR
ncbi:U2 snRNP-associated SURP motif-containing protein [Amphibalanus amphitrite]|uniref:U2 snRNP-associated SURP motif-containing protein n=1 Tax=Amphibalanus amphitrite TaxID=1232801 RepID=A0A6A4VR49_AMPAM|nr:U2 snRNP-associated SURP motif-containing protein [Amphibalanus amphitrite]